MYYNMIGKNMKRASIPKEHSVINVRVEDKVKQQSQELFESLGLNVSTAVNIFLKKSIEAGGIPFAVKHSKQTNYRVNNKTLEAIESASEAISKRTKPEGYSNADEAMKAMLNAHNNNIQE